MPEGVQDSFGFKLDRAQIGRHPVGARPFGEGLPAGILKLTADDGGETYRAAYVVELAGVVYVLDVFQKKSKAGARTPKTDKARVRQRYQWARQHYEANRQRYLEDAEASALVPSASRRRRGDR
jgi:phage-related protein